MENLQEVNPALVGPIIYATIEAVKRTGWLPTNYIQMVSVIVAVVVAFAVSVEPSTLAILSNAGAIYLATEGTVKNTRKVTDGNPDQ